MKKRNKKPKPKTVGWIDNSEDETKDEDNGKNEVEDKNKDKKIGKGPADLKNVKQKQCT